MLITSILPKRSRASSKASLASSSAWARHHCSHRASAAARTEVPAQVRKG